MFDCSVAAIGGTGIGNDAYRGKPEACAVHAPESAVQEESCGASEVRR